MCPLEFEDEQDPAQIEVNDINEIIDDDEYEFIDDDEDVEEITTNYVDGAVKPRTSQPWDDIEETYLERLYGLKEMFPEPLLRITKNTFNRGKAFLTSCFYKSKSALWYVSTTLILMVFPSVIMIEMARMDETQMAQQQKATTSAYLQQQQNMTGPAQGLEPQPF